MRLQGFGSLSAEIPGSKDAGKPDRSVIAHGNSDPVAAIDQAKDRLQLVQPVSPPAEHVQEEVQLAWRGKPLERRIYFHSETATRNSSPG
jgi:hypothetical protein